MENNIKKRIILTEQQASEMIKFMPATLRKRRWQGLPPQYLKIGSRVYYDYDILEKFLKSCICNSTSEYNNGE